MDVDFCLKLISQFTESIMKYHKDKFVQVNNFYDLRAVGPERYTDYTVLSSQLELELQYLLTMTLPRIREMKEKLVQQREEVVEAITDCPDCEV